MFETILSVQDKYAYWLNNGAENLSSALKSSGATCESYDAYGKHCFYITCASDKKAASVKAIKSFLTELYCSKLKREYFTERLNFRHISAFSREIIMQTLVAFDRERDAEYVADCLQIENEFSADGFFDFRLQELKRRWGETVLLTEENMDLLHDDGALNLLLRFLLSAVAPQSETVRILERDGKYIIKPSYEPLCSDERFSDRELIMKLLEIAPMEIVFGNNISDRKLINRLSEIFDVKGVNNTITFGENQR